VGTELTGELEGCRVGAELDGILLGIVGFLDDGILEGKRVVGLYEGTTVGISEVGATNAGDAGFAGLAGFEGEAGDDGAS
jgi:hypothetical protein